MFKQPPTPRLRRLLGSSLLLAALLGTGVVPGFRPASVQAATADTMEDSILTWVNQSRVAIGLVPLRSDSRLRDLAGYRAGVMASTGVLSHTIAGCLSCQLNDRGIQWFATGEVIAYTTYAWGDAAAKSMYDWWHGSSGHWALLMSPYFNYVGVGIAYRSANASSWGSIVLTESDDHSPASATIRSGTVSGTTVTWSWIGVDLPLQTHTAGLRNYDVQFRVGSGTWTTLYAWTTLKSLSRTGAHGQYLGLRVRSRDWKLNVSWWSPEYRVWVP
jgi:uncharacterized protein YkwD